VGHRAGVGSADRHRAPAPGSHAAPPAARLCRTLRGHVRAYRRIYECDLSRFSAILRDLTRSYAILSDFWRWPMPRDFSPVFPLYESPKNSLNL
jgi:hypothetical protein